MSKIHSNIQGANLTSDVGIDVHKKLMKYQKNTVNVAKIHLVQVLAKFCPIVGNNLSEF